MSRHIRKSCGKNGRAGLSHGRSGSARWHTSPGSGSAATDTGRFGTPEWRSEQVISVVQPVFPATLFDYNGVLVDDEVVHLAAFRDVLGPLGIELDERDYWERISASTTRAHFTRSCPTAGRAPTEAEVRALDRGEAAAIPRAGAATRLEGFPGAAELVRRRARSRTRR